MEQKELDRIIPRPKQGASLYIFSDEINAQYKRYVYLGYRWHDQLWVLKDIAASEEKKDWVYLVVSQEELAKKRVYYSLKDAEAFILKQAETNYQSAQKKYQEALTYEEAVEDIYWNEAHWYAPDSGPRPSLLLGSFPSDKMITLRRHMDTLLAYRNSNPDRKYDLWAYSCTINKSESTARRYVQDALNYVLKGFRNFGLVKNEHIEDTCRLYDDKLLELFHDVRGRHQKVQ